MGTDQVDIIPVETRAQWREFHHLPFRIYRDDPHWVAPLLLERRFHFLPKHNPFFEHATAAFFLARKNGEPVGRISAQVDRLHVERHGKSGHFGFIEAIDDPPVFERLLSAAEAWLRKQGMQASIGPVSFSLWDQPGLLVKGFDTPPYVMMAHARPYFAPHVEAAGYRPVQDLIAYRYAAGESKVPHVMQRVLDRALRRGDLRLRTIRMEKGQIENEVALLLDIINDAWSDNWGFVPMTKAEIDDLAGILKVLLRPGDVAIAEYKGEPAAFAAVFPNLNEAIRDLNGRLLPLGWAKILWRMKIKHTKTARMPMMGVRKALQSSPVGAALALAVIQGARAFNVEHGLEDSELSWILASNPRVQHVIELVGGVEKKRYRIYEKAL
jgi:hypothetical protein